MWNKLTIKTPERRQWCRFRVFIVEFEHISHIALRFSVLKFYPLPTFYQVFMDNYTCERKLLKLCPNYPHRFKCFKEIYKNVLFWICDYLTSAMPCLHYCVYFRDVSLLVWQYSKLTIEVLEKGVKCVQS